MLIGIAVRQHVRTGHPNLVKVSYFYKFRFYVSWENSWRHNETETVVNSYLAMHGDLCGTRTRGRKTLEKFYGEIRNVTELWLPRYIRNSLWCRHCRCTVIVEQCYWNLDSGSSDRHTWVARIAEGLPVACTLWKVGVKFQNGADDGLRMNSFVDIHTE